MLKNNLELRKLSSFCTSKEYKYFIKEIEAAYNATSHISKDYPEHFKWFFTKMIPGVFKCEREIINLYIDNTLAGTIFLKNSNEEKKICTNCFLCYNYYFIYGHAMAPSNYSQDGGSYSS